MPVSVVQASKRLLVTLLLTLARRYHVTLTISRESDDKEVVKAFRKIVLKAHPDKGGSAGDAQKLNEARGAWEDAKKNSNPGPKPATQPTSSPDGLTISPAQPSAKKGFRIQSIAVLLTYHGARR